MTPAVDGRRAGSPVESEGLRNLHSLNNRKAGAIDNIEKLVLPMAHYLVTALQNPAR